MDVPIPYEALEKLWGKSLLKKKIKDLKRRSLLEIHGEGDDLVVRLHNLQHMFVKYEAKSPYCRRELSQSCMVHSNALIKKEYLEKVILPNGEIFDSRLHGPASQGFIGCTEDYDLWLRLSYHCIMCHVPESLSIVNESGQNQSMKMTPEIFQQQAQILGSR